MTTIGFQELLTKLQNIKKEGDVPPIKFDNKTNKYNISSLNNPIIAEFVTNICSDDENIKKKIIEYLRSIKGESVNKSVFEEGLKKIYDTCYPTPPAPPAPVVPSAAPVVPGFIVANPAKAAANPPEAAPDAAPAPAPVKLTTENNTFEVFKNTVNNKFTNDKKYLDQNIILSYSILPEKILAYKGTGLFNMNRSENNTKIQNKDGNEVNIPVDQSGKTDIEVFKKYIQDTLNTGVDSLNIDESKKTEIKGIITKYANVNYGNDGKNTKTDIQNAFNALDKKDVNTDSTFVVSPVTAILKASLSLQQEYAQEEKKKLDTEAEEQRLATEAKANQERLEAERVAAEKAAEEKTKADAAQAEAEEAARIVADAEAKAEAEKKAAAEKAKADAAAAELKQHEDRIKQLEEEKKVIDTNIAKTQRDIAEINSKNFKATVSFHLLLGDGNNEHKLLYISPCEVTISEFTGEIPGEDVCIPFNSKNISSLLNSSNQLELNDFTTKIKDLLDKKIQTLTPVNKPSLYSFMNTYNEYAINSVNKIKYYDINKHNVMKPVIDKETFKVTYGIYLNKSTNKLCCTVDNIEYTTGTNLPEAYLLTNEPTYLEENIRPVIADGPLKSDFLNLGNEVYNSVNGGKRKSKRKSKSTKRRYKKNRKTHKRKYRKTRR
jgi:hypothetical protein